MHMTVLPEFMCLYHVPGKVPGMGTVSPGSAGNCKSRSEFWESNLGPPYEQQEFLIVKLSLHLPYLAFCLSVGQSVYVYIIFKNIQMYSIYTIVPLEQLEINFYGSNCGYNVLHLVVTLTHDEFVLTSADTDSLGVFEMNLA